MTFTFIKNHTYFSGVLGLILLGLLVAVPFLLIADSREKNCPIYDRDCDGVRACTPSNQCDPNSPDFDSDKFGKSDWVDTDPNVGSTNSVIIDAVRDLAR